MKVTYPHMGNLYLAANALLEGLGCEVIMPPFCSKKTLSLGTKYAPESACLPLKINLGNYLEAIEKGADTIVMIGGVGPCRIGFYGQTQSDILNDLGKNIKMVVIEPPDVSFKEVWQKIMELKNASWVKVIKGVHLAWEKIYSADRLEKYMEWLRPRAIKQDEAEKIYNEALILLDKTKNIRQVKNIVKNTLHKLEELADYQAENIIKIGIVGEVYTVIEQYANLQLERQLGKLGVEVERSIYLSEWINDHLLSGILPIKSSKKIDQLASPFLNHFIGGHGKQTISHSVDFARRGFDGIIQVGPLTCMPEIVAESILPAINETYGVPIMTIFVDEQSGEAGLNTRLEAFTDMIKYKKDLNFKGCELCQSI
ncbi:CoA protein activase [Bacillota bacterium LX-D]|nr:CoA protein activase [Bacillota bacterium LX-D]